MKARKCGHESEHMLFREAQNIAARLPPDQAQARRVLGYVTKLLDFQDEAVAWEEEDHPTVVPLAFKRLRAPAAFALAVFVYEISQFAGQAALNAVV
jgi:hypothetical protein